MPDDIHGSSRLRVMPKTTTEPVYLTASAAAALAGVEKRTIAAHVEPDASYTSIQGTKRFPLYRPEAIMAFRDTYQRPPGGPVRGAKRAGGAG